MDDSFNEMVWYKKFGNSSGFVSYTTVTEPLLVYGKCPIRRYNTDLFECMTDRGDGMREFHPCPKPVELLVSLIEPQTKQHQIILDVFLGSGSTLVASEKIGRQCYGMEIDAYYCDVIAFRYVDFVGTHADAWLERDGQRTHYSEMFDVLPVQISTTDGSSALSEAAI